METKVELLMENWRSFINESNIFDNIRKKKEQCKENPSLAKCKKEDRPSPENWKKATKNEDTRDTYGSEVVDRNKKTFDDALVEKSEPKKIKLKLTRGLDEKKKKPCKKAKGKKYVKRVNGRCRSFGQSGQAKDGGPRIRPGTKKGDAYCARSAKIKKCKEPPCANDLSRKKWKCRGSKSMKENEKALSEANWWEKPPIKPKKDQFARPRRKEEPKKDPFSRSRSRTPEWWGNDDHEPQPGEVGGDVPPDGHIYYAWKTDDLDLDMKIKKIRPDGKYEVWVYHGF